MAEIVLDQAQVAPGMSQGMPARMPQHVRMDSIEPGSCRNDRHEIVDGLPRHGLVAFGQEQPGQAVLPLAEEAPDREQLIACQRMAGGKTALQAVHPEMSCFQIKIAAAQGDQLADPQPVSVHQQQHEMIAPPVPIELGCDQQVLNLIGGQVISTAQIRIHRLAAVTLDKRPVGPLSGHVALPCN